MHHTSYIGWRTSSGSSLNRTSPPLPRRHHHRVAHRPTPHSGLQIARSPRPGLRGRPGGITGQVWTRPSSAFLPACPPQPTGVAAAFTPLSTNRIVLCCGSRIGWTCRVVGSDLCHSACAVVTVFPDLLGRGVEARVEAVGDSDAQLLFVQALPFMNVDSPSLRCSPAVHPQGHRQRAVPKDRRQQRLPRQASGGLAPRRRHLRRLRRRCRCRCRLGLLGGVLRVSSGSRTSQSGARWRARRPAHSSSPSTSRCRGAPWAASPVLRTGAALRRELLRG